MLIHFVCTGNSYRSRMAEAYFNSKGVPDTEATSSGIGARKNESGPITWEAARIIKNNRLIDNMSVYWTQTTADTLKKADVVVFMQDLHYQYVVKHLEFNSAKYHIWDVKDIDGYGLKPITQSLDEDIALIKVAEKTFKKIQDNVDKLVRGMKQQHILDKLQQYA